MANSADRPVCRTRRHRPGDAPLCAPDLHVCATCRDVVEEALVDLPSLFEVCAYALDKHSDGPHERVSGHRPEGIVLRDSVVALRSDILGVVASWCGLVTGERGVEGPNELALRRMAGFLAVHVQWLCGQPVAPDLVDELSSLVTRVHDVLRPEAGFRVAAGTCLYPGCGRTVHAESHHRSAKPYAVTCENGHVWEPGDWLLLRGTGTGTGTGQATPSPRPSTSGGTP
jgi:hypothetical protein